MSYTPTQWETGDIVTAEKLNKLENGVAAAGSGGGGAFIVNATMDGDTMTLDKTWKEIDDAILTSPVFVVVDVSGSGVSSKASIFVAQTSVLNGSYVVITYNEVQFTANSENGYPSSSK